MKLLILLICCFVDNSTEKTCFCANSITTDDYESNYSEDSISSASESECNLSYSQSSISEPVDGDEFNSNSVSTESADSYYDSNSCSASKGTWGKNPYSVRYTNYNYNNLDNDDVYYDADEYYGKDDYYGNENTYAANGYYGGNDGYYGGYDSCGKSYNYGCAGSGSRAISRISGFIGDVVGRKVSISCLAFGDSGCRWKCGFMCTLYCCTYDNAYCNANNKCICGEEVYDVGLEQKGLSTSDFQTLPYVELWKDTFEDDFYSQKLREKIRKDKRIEGYISGWLRNAHVTGDDIKTLLLDEFPNLSEVKFLKSRKKIFKNEILGSGKNLKYDDLMEHFDEVVENMKNKHGYVIEDDWKSKSADIEKLIKTELSMDDLDEDEIIDLTIVTKFTGDKTKAIKTGAQEMRNSKVASSSANQQKTSGTVKNFESSGSNVNEMAWLVNADVDEIGNTKSKYGAQEMQNSKVASSSANQQKTSGTVKNFESSGSNVNEMARLVNADVDEIGNTKSKYGAQEMQNSKVASSIANQQKMSGTVKNFESSGSNVNEMAWLVNADVDEFKNTKSKYYYAEEPALQNSVGVSKCKSDAMESSAGTASYALLDNADAVSTTESFDLINTNHFSSNTDTSTIVAKSDSRAVSTAATATSTSTAQIQNDGAAGLYYFVIDQNGNVVQSSGIPKGLIKDSGNSFVVNYGNGKIVQGQ